MGNELKRIVDLLADEYGSNPLKFEVVATSRLQDGLWSISVKRIEPKESKEQEVQDDN